MATTNKGRFTAEIEGDFVVFIIGAKPDPLHLVRSLKDLGGARGMKKMLDYLVAHPDKGLLGYELLGFGNVLQYWRSFEHLEAFAKDKDDPHLQAWRSYVARVGKSGRTGIWHETYLVRAGEFEAIYTNMPTYGLAKASSLVAVSDSTAARDRLKAKHS
jgi:hypothetical protein